jgi:hypothetical protein
MSSVDALGTGDLGLPQPPLAVSMAKVHRKGKNLELSGEETFRGIALPISKALNHLRVSSTPGGHRMYFDVRLVFPLAVLRAPLLTVRVENERVDLQDTPWVRLLRSEPDSDGWSWRWPSMTGFDIVQFDYLSTYATAAKRAAEEAALRIAEFAPQLLTGVAVSAESSPGEKYPPYKTLIPHVDVRGLEEILRERFRAAHATQGVGKVVVMGDLDGLRHAEERG